MAIKHLYCNPTNSLLQIYKIFNEAAALGLPTGIALVVDENNSLTGCITEGDVRRAIVNKGHLDLKVNDIMQSDPICFDDTFSISEILDKIPVELSTRNRKSNKFLSKIILVNKSKQPTRVLDYYELWEQKVAMHRHLVVIGLGYVGLTMAAVMADAGFMVTGVEVDNTRLKKLLHGDCYIHELGLPELIKEQLGKNLHVSSEIPDNGDVFIISVGTPVASDLAGNKKPDMAFLEDACTKVGQNLKRGHLVILRSTVPIGTSRNFVKKRLEEESNLSCGRDFHLSFAPERTAEGKALKELRSLPQIIGGYNQDSVEATAAIFRDLTSTLVRVESLEAAEMAKLINNSFRDYVFAYSNHLAKIASCFNININDVIKAANEGYPRDPVPLPSPGVGGPCLTKDPYIFASVANEYQFDGDVFIKARTINESMHDHVYDSVMKQAKLLHKKQSEINILICGLAFKGNPETGDIRNSSAIEIAKLFKGKVKQVFGQDYIAMKNEIEEYDIISVNIPEGFTGMDVVLFLNNHKNYEKINIYEMVRNMNEQPIIFDGWNLYRHEEILNAKPCVYMGLSYVKSSVIRES